MLWVEYAVWIRAVRGFLIADKSCGEIALMCKTIYVNITIILILRQLP